MCGGPGGTGCGFLPGGVGVELIVELGLVAGVDAVLVLVQSFVLLLHHGGNVRFVHIYIVLVDPVIDYVKCRHLVIAANVAHFVRSGLLEDALHVRD